MYNLDWIEDGLVEIKSEEISEIIMGNYWTRIEEIAAVCIFLGMYRNILNSKNY